MTDLPDKIAKLELEIAELEEAEERSRKTMLLAKFAIAAGGMLVPLIIIGTLRFGSVALLGSVTAAIGGIVAFGATKSTRDGLRSRIVKLEQRRAEMIDDLRLRTVQPTGSPPAFGRPGRRGNLARRI